VAAFTKPDDDDEDDLVGVTLLTKDIALPRGVVVVVVGVV